MKQTDKVGHYLQLAVGPYELLMGAEQVLEVLDEAPRQAGGGWCQWRGRSLPMIDLRSKLGLEAGGGRAVVVQGGADHDGETVVRVDRVIGLRRLDETIFVSLPPLLPSFAALFDKALADATGQRLLLRCRPSLA